MLNGKRILAVIPARGGSKRIPKKNIMVLNGKPLLAYAIEAAKQIPELDRTVVSSENDEILSLAVKYGGEALKRPAELSQDSTKDEPVLFHALDELEKRGETYDFVVMLQVTSPMRTAQTTRDVILKAVEGDYDVVATVIEDRSYFRTFRNGEWTPIVPDAPRSSLEREPFYKEAGVCYAMKVEPLRRTGMIFARKKEGFVIVSEIEGIDINTPFDADFVRFLKSNESAP